MYPYFHRLVDLTDEKLNELVKDTAARSAAYLQAFRDEPAGFFNPQASLPHRAVDMLHHLLLEEIKFRAGVPCSPQHGEVRQLKVAHA